MQASKLPVLNGNNVKVPEKSLILTAIQGFPRVKRGEQIDLLLIKLLEDKQMVIENGDVFVIAQKIVSKAEGRMVNLSTISPSDEAIRLRDITQKDPRFIELVLRESKKVLRTKLNTLIVEHKKGFICANAGIDHSNVGENELLDDNWVLLLPEDPDRSADMIRQGLESHFKKRVGVLVIDSHGRAWRNGTIGMTIGISGLPGLVDLRGEKDLLGYRLKNTTIGAADELAAGASLLMGQAAEGTPVIHVRGFPYVLREAKLDELIRPEQEDLFR